MHIQASSNREQQGLTLVEVAVVCAVVAIGVGITIPSFSDFRSKRVVEASARELGTDFKLARSEAAARHQRVTVSFSDSAAGSCYVIHTGGAADCPCQDGAASPCHNDAQAIKTVFIGNDQHVRVQSNVTNMLFDPIRGTTSPAGTVTISGADSHSIRQIVSLMGRVQTCSPSRDMYGYKSC